MKNLPIYLIYLVVPENDDAKAVVQVVGRQSLSPEAHVR